MDKPRHAGGMELVVLIAFLLLIGPLAVLFGVDSRLDERGRWPEWRRM
jgi:hypothetical protein